MIICLHASPHAILPLARGLPINSVSSSESHVTRHVEANVHSLRSGRWDAEVMVPPLGINHTRLDEGSCTDGGHGKDQVDARERLEIEELEDPGSGSSL